MVRIASRLCGILLILIVAFEANVEASLTKEQGEDVALFATTFIEKGNERRDENGYPLLVYALSGNGKTSIEIRRSGYFGELYYIKNNGYHMKNGKYLELGPKWCMDCGDFISYVYKTTLGLDMYLEDVEDPWHIRDMYADANKYENSEIFEFVYKNVPISKIDESKLEKGDVIIRMGSNENHGLIYVDEGFMAAHASRNAIKYSKTPVILGFDVVAFNKFYKTSTVVSIIRVKDGVVSPDQKVNSTIVWPDTGEEETLIEIIENKIPLQSCKVIDAEGHNDLIKINAHNIKVLTGLKSIDNEQSFFYKVIEIKMNSNYVRNQVFNWLAMELKRLLMQIYG